VLIDYWFPSGYGTDSQQRDAPPVHLFDSEAEALELDGFAHVGHVS
jgi:hypothetical protein